MAAICLCGRWTTILFAAAGKIKARTLEILELVWMNRWTEFHLFILVRFVSKSLNLASLTSQSTIHYPKLSTTKTDDQVFPWKPCHVFPPHDEHHHSAHHCLKPGILFDANYRAFEKQAVTMLSSPPTMILSQASLCHVFPTCLHASHHETASFSSQQSSLCFTYLAHSTIRSSDKLLAITVTQEQQNCRNSCNIILAIVGFGFYTTYIFRSWWIFSYIQVLFRGMLR